MSDFHIMQIYHYAPSYPDNLTRFFSNMFYPTLTMCAHIQNHFANVTICTNNSNVNHLNPLTQCVCLYQKYPRVLEISPWIGYIPLVFIQQVSFACTSRAGIKSLKGTCLEFDCFRRFWLFVYNKQM